MRLIHLTTQATAAMEIKSVACHYTFAKLSKNLNKMLVKEEHGFQRGRNVLPLLQELKKATPRKGKRVTVPTVLQTWSIDTVRK